MSCFYNVFVLGEGVQKDQEEVAKVTQSSSSLVGCFVRVLKSPLFRRVRKAGKFHHCFSVFPFLFHGRLVN